MDEKNKKSYLLFFIIGGLFGIITSSTLGGLMGYGNGISNTLFYGAIGYGICAIINKEHERLWHAFLLIISGLIFQLIINSVYFY